jgi:hypothetical protein
VCLVASACYHQVIQTGRTPGTTIVAKPWAPAFVFGLVPPPPLDVSKECPTGVAIVETQQSFLNGLVAALTFGLYAPIEIKVTCAQGRASLDGLKQINVGQNFGAAQREAAFLAAIELSARTSQPVVIRY